ncbi:MAG: class I SAM-dependent methyltransferase [Halobacteriales archaeon]
MPGTRRDRLWVAALALARTRDAFTAEDALEAADLAPEYRRTAIEVLAAMAEHGYVDPAPGGWRAGTVRSWLPKGFDGRFTYLTAPNTRWTFAPAAVRTWVESRLEGRVLDLFAGGVDLRHDGEVVRNDIDESVDADHHFDAVEVADRFDPDSFDTVVLDPPLDGRGAAPERVRDRVATVLSPGGRVVQFGRSSTGMGRARGFETEELCLINHPGSFRDTIAVVERRTPEARDSCPPGV